jgi:hypothetical protein
VVRDYLQIAIVALPTSATEALPWSLEVITAKDLEEIYVSQQMGTNSGKQVSTPLLRKREKLYRNRFRRFLQDLTLYISQDHKLNIESSIRGQKIEITDY